MKRREIAAFIVVGLIWGSAWIPSITLLQQIPPFAAGALRYIVASILLFAAWIVTGAKRPRQKVWRVSAVLGLTFVAAPYVLTVWAVGQISSGLTAVIYAALPFIIFLASGAADSTVMKPLVLGLSGIVITVSNALSMSLFQIRGAILLAISILLSALSLIYAKKRLAGENLLQASAIQCGVAAIFCAGLSVFFEHPSVSYLRADGLVSAISLAVFSSGVALPLYYWLLTRWEAEQVATSQWIITLVAIAEAAVILREKVPAVVGVGAAIVIVSLGWTLTSSGSDKSAVTLEITSGPHKT